MQPCIQVHEDHVVGKSGARPTARRAQGQLLRLMGAVSSFSILFPNDTATVRVRYPGKESAGSREISRYPHEDHPDPHHVTNLPSHVLAWTPAL